MANITDKTVKSKYPPKDTNVTWIDTSSKPYVSRSYINGSWEVVGGGVTDYEDIKNKPTINGVELDGNKTSSDLGMATSQQGAKADSAYQKPSSGIPQSDLSSDVQSQLSKHFKGWFASVGYLETEYPSPVVGDYAYVKGVETTDPAAIYECATAGSWSDSGRTADTSNVQTFASSQEVNEVHIVNDLTTGGVDDVLSAEQGKLLKQEVDENYVTVSNDTLSIGGDDKGELAGQIIQNPEYIQVTVDSNGKIIEGIKSDGIKELNVPLKLQGVKQETIEHPEFIQVVTDENGKLIEATRKDGKKVFFAGIEEVDSIRKEICNMVFLRDYQFLKPIYSIGHRGYSYQVPENTFQAFLHAKQQGFDFAEFDVQFTSDGVPVLMHDVTINRVARNEDGTELSDELNIRDITYSQAMEYDYGIYMGEQWAGLKLLTLEEALIISKKLGLLILLESKYNTKEEIISIVQMVREYDMLECCIFQSFDMYALRIIVEQYPQAKLLLLSSLTQTAVNDILSLSNTANNLFIGLNYTSVNSKSDIELAVNNNINVVLYTVDDDSYIVNSMPLGVFGVISNRYVASKLLNDDLMSQIIQ